MTTAKDTPDQVKTFVLFRKVNRTEQPVASSEDKNVLTVIRDGQLAKDIANGVVSTFRIV